MTPLSFLQCTHFELRSNVSSVNAPLALNVNNVASRRMHIIFPSATHHHSDVTHISRSHHSPVSQSSLAAPEHHHRTFRSTPSIADGLCGAYLSTHQFCVSHRLPHRCHCGLHLLWISFRMFRYIFQSKFVHRLQVVIV